MAMKIKSLARKTDLLFARFSGEVIIQKNYTAIKTPSNPGYHWGNYLVFDKAPIEGDFQKWKDIFQKEFPYYSTPQHMVFTWEEEKKGAIEEFLENGFEFDEGKILSCKKLVYPKKYKSDINIKKIQTNDEWEDVIKLQVMTADPKFINAGYENFKRKQMKQYREMSEQSLGHWFGAYFDGKLVGDLGIFHTENIGRYQNVGTHPNFRRQGICQTLVYETGLIAYEEYDIETLVMEADTHYHAAKIYESVGFIPTEKSYALSWWTDHD